MPRPHLLFALAGGLSIALACGSGPGDIISSRGSDYGREHPGDAEGYGTLDQAELVAPDRAVLRVDVTVQAPDAATAAQQLRVHASAVEQSVAASPCTAQLLDYQPPAPAGRDAWRSAAELRVDIPLSGLDGVAARMDAIDACHTALAAALTDPEGEEIDGTVATAWAVRTAQPVLLVDDLQQHAGPLLARRAARLAVFAAEQGAPQLHPEDLRCTATGDVRYGQRRLSGVQLIVGMDCRIATPAADVP
jgi:hypothetical protein